MPDAPATPAVASPTIFDYIQNALPTWAGGSAVTANEASNNAAAAAAQIQAVATSPGGQQPVSTMLANDQALVNGQTYTFTFTGPGATVASVTADIVGQAPDFLTQVVVTPVNGGGLNVQFVYEGDGSDLVQDVASSIVGAALVVNNDNLGFVSASQQTTVGAVIAPTIVKQVAASNTDQQVLADSANAAAKAQDTASLTSGLVWIAVGLAVFIVVAPMVLGATTPKVSVGGA
jgi:hypothetical protein